jgi:hypothetical protein
MEAIVRVALMLFFVQFVVVMGIMIVALLMARPYVATLGRESGYNTLRRSCGFVIRLPSRVLRSASRRAHSSHLHSVH